MLKCKLIKALNELRKRLPQGTNEAIMGQQGGLNEALIVLKWGSMGDQMGLNGSSNWAQIGTLKALFLLV